MFVLSFMEIINNDYYVLCAFLFSSRFVYVVNVKKRT